MYPHIFEPGRIGPLALKNRLIHAPMVRNYANASGRAGRRYEAHVARIARGGVAAITLEAAYVREDGKGFHNQLGLHDDAVIPGLQRLVRAAHGHDAKVGIQLYHAGRQTRESVTGQRPVAPSAEPCPLLGETPRALRGEEVGAMVEAFGLAADRAARAGMDYVEIHGAHGYLITQFLSSASNHRKDAYGGDQSGRTRFLKEVFQEVRSRVGPDTAILVRLSGEEMVAGGLTIGETAQIAQRLEQWGADAVHISCGNYGSFASGRMIPPMAVADGPLLKLAETVKAAVSIPVITVGKIRTPDMAERALADGVADFVALGRPLLADPDWPLKAEAGEIAWVDHCIACNQGCIQRLFEDKDVWCTVNPEAGREDEFAAAEPAGRRKVVVIGGGPTGMTAAIMARRHGHQVTLFEKSDRLGGLLFAAEAAPHRPGWTELRRYLAAETRRSGVRVQTGAEVSYALVEDEKPDVVIVATGAAVRRRAWPQVNEIPVATSQEILSGAVAPAPQIVMAGGGCAGAQTAEFLAEAGSSVVIVEKSGSIATEAPLDDRALLMERLRRVGVELLTNTRIVSAGAGKVTVDGPGGRRNLDAGMLVACIGSDPDHTLARELAGVAETIIEAGDCRGARRVTDAMLEGALAGTHLSDSGYAGAHLPAAVMEGAPPEQLDALAGLAAQTPGRPHPAPVR